MGFTRRFASKKVIFFCFFRFFSFFFTFFPPGQSIRYMNRIIYMEVIMRHGKSRMRGVWEGLCAALILGAAGCEAFSMDGTPAGREDQGISIATWNIQALFDGEESGVEYDEYRGGAGWSAEKYEARLTMLAKAIGSIGAAGSVGSSGAAGAAGSVGADGTDGLSGTNGVSDISGISDTFGALGASGAAGMIEEKTPDVVALQEVENGSILEDLVKGPLAKEGYGHTFFASNPGAPLGLGVLSRFPLVSARAHSINYNGETSPRPIIEVWIQPRDQPLVLFICHWKSKLGGDDVTETLRRASARILFRRVREIEGQYPETPVVIMGDLNENYDEFYRQAGTLVSALLPDDPRAAELAGFQGEEEDAAAAARGAGGGAAGDAAVGATGTTGAAPLDFLILSREKPPRADYFPTPALVLYSPWGNELQRGSYSYKNEWETIDHFLFTPALFDQRGWEFETCAVLARQPFTNAGGYPDAYNPRTGHGLSDHLPLLLRIGLAD
jgi:endonuclease/exonuclease/phosphatase family metal-dependent hydrolase